MQQCNSNPNPLYKKAEFQKIAEKIYPSWLKLKLEDSGKAVNYLDMTIWWECGEDVKWHSRLYDKKIGMIAKGLKLNRFPHPKSKLSRRCKYGVITSQLHRYKVACTQNKHFLEPALSLYSAYLHKGFKVNIVDRYFERFIRSKIPGVRPNAVKQLYEQEHKSL